MIELENGPNWVMSKFPLSPSPSVKTAGSGSGQKGPTRALIR